MKPRKKSPEPNDDMFRSRLEHIINMRHELVKLSEQIDWDYIDREAGQYRAIVKLGDAAKSAGISLRQSVERNWIENELSDSLRIALEKAKHTHQQKVGDQDYCYSWHCSEVEYIGKGKAHKPYEFGNKVSITTNVQPAPGGHFVLHVKSLHGKPYDGHTLKQVLEEKVQQTGLRTQRTYVDKGYRGHKVKGHGQVYLSGQRRGVTAVIKKELRRRSVVELIIGHVKHDCRMIRNYLKGTLGDNVNAVLAATGYNVRRLLAWLRKLFGLGFYWLLLRLEKLFLEFSSEKVGC